MRTPRSTRAWLPRALALVLAATTAVVVLTDLARIDREAHDLGPRVTVVVATTELPLGHRIERADVRAVTRHASQVPRSALHDTRATVGAIVRVPMLADTVVQLGNVTGRSSTVDAAIPRGYRAVMVSDRVGLSPEAGTVVDLVASTGVETALDGTTAAAPSVVVARGAVVISATTTKYSRVDPGRITEDGASRAIIVLVREREVTAVARASATESLSVVLAPTEEACCVTR